MPRYIVTGTRVGAPGTHEVRIEAGSREEASRFAAESHGLHVVDVTEPGAGQRIVRDIREGVEPLSVFAALGCLWLTILFTLVATVAVFFYVYKSGSDQAAWLVLMSGALSVAVPLALIAIIELLRRILRKVGE